MTITLTTDLTYPLPGRHLVRVSSNTAGVNFVRLWCTDAPAGSKMRAKIDSAPGGDRTVARVEIGTASVGSYLSFGKTGTADSFEPDGVEFDIGGVYVFRGQEYTKGTTYGGGYENSPDAFQTETKVGGEQANIKIYIGERLEQRIGNSTHGSATLVIYVWNDTIRETTLASHKVVSPAIINPRGDLAKLAVVDANVKTKLYALIGKTMSDLRTNVATLIAEMIDDISDHMKNVDHTQHTTPDDDNGDFILELPDDPGSPEGYVNAARVLLQRLLLHMAMQSNDTGVVHSDPDWENAAIADVPSPGRITGSFWSAVADVYRAYEAHRQEGSPIHTSATSTNNALGTALNALLDLHKQFLSVMQPYVPINPASFQQAVAEGAALGFSRPS